MRISQLDDFIASIRLAPYEHKRDWVRSNVKGRDVLDLGVVAHSLDFCLNHRDTWLHEIIKNNGSYVLGVDILEPEVNELRRMGYNVLAADVLTLRLDRKFDVVVCGDLIEHVSNPGALLDTIAYHLRDDGTALVTTPNPFAISRMFNILADGWTGINTEHVSWLCPQTMCQLVERSQLFVSDFCWLETDFPMPTRARFWGRIFNYCAPVMARKNQLLRNDYGVLLRKAMADVQTPETDRPFVSVILPTYNRSDYLIGALRTLVAQDYPPGSFEVIVVDNASTDDTRDRLNRFTQEVSGTINVRYAREERRGLVFVRHTGAAHARGEILIFCDDDAVFDKNWISAVVEVYQRFPEVGAVGTKIAIQWNREPEAWVRRYEDILGKLDYGNDTVVKRGLFINGGSFSVKKSVLYRVNGFNPGQRGAYIVGDSETGLCRKLANEAILVGWTPAATMWHLQRVEVNGTLEDLKRRFRNNGIADAYLATFYRWGRRDVVRDFIRKSFSILTRLFWAIRWRDWEKFRYAIPLELALYLYYVKYLWLYRFSSTIRNEVSKRDWQFTKDFQSPAVESLAEYRKDAIFDNGHVAQR